MSLPGLVAQPLMGTVATATLSPLEAIIGSFNGNLYFIGIMMLILNLGGRFLAMEITKEQEAFFQNPWIRRFLIFVVLFVATRNIIVAFWLTVVVVIVLGFLFNENSALSIFGKAATQDGPKQSMTPEEVEIFRRLNEKRLRHEQANMGSEDDKKKKKKDADPFMVYMANMSLLSPA